MRLCLSFIVRLLADALYQLFKVSCLSQKSWSVRAHELLVLSDPKFRGKMLRLLFLQGNLIEKKQLPFIGVKLVLVIHWLHESSMILFNDFKLLSDGFKLELLRLVILLEPLITIFSASFTDLDLWALSPNLWARTSFILYSDT